jgi:hypothetical protein
MLIADYEHGSKHDDVISHWFDIREMDRRGLLELPVFGCVVYNSDTPIAIGFLRQIEDGFAMFDSIITDPNQPAEMRNEALDFLFDGLIKKAKSINIKQIFGFTLDANTVERSLKHGFQKQHYTTAVLDLTRG